MSRIFSYLRVSTTEQSAENQLIAITKAGYDIESHRVISETVSGSKPAMDRPQFKELVNSKLESGDTLVCLKLDRLGRNNSDVLNTVKLLTDKGVKLVSLDLPIRDLTSSEGEFMLGIFSAFSQFELGRLKERTKEGLERAVKNGTKLGRPPATVTTKNVQKLKADGLTQSMVVDALNISLPTVKRHWNKSV